MKILHIGKYFPPYSGGMENYLRDLMTDQARRGEKPEALVHSSDRRVVSRREIYYTCGQELPVMRAAVWARLLFTPISPTFGWLLARQIRTSRPDILHMHVPNVSVFWALILPKARKIPWVVHWHSDVLASRHSGGLRIFYKMYRPFERAMLRHCKVVVATSKPYLESSVSLRDYRHKCHVIPLGLDPVKMPATQPASKGRSTEMLRVLAIGRLTYYKGFEFLIRAAAHCEKAEIHLVGTGDQEASLKALSHELKLGNRITFHGNLSDVQLATEFELCDCLCLPSIERSEAFGMVLLEAMYYRRATIVSEVPGSGMTWVVDDNVTGLHVPPENASALADSMHHLLKDRDKIRLLAENGRKKFDQQFHISKSSNTIAELYKAVLKETQASPQQAKIK